MKKLLLIFLLLFSVTILFGQNIGISDNTAFNPSFMFHLQPSAAYASDLFSIQNNTGTYYFHVKINGRIGIGAGGAYNPNSLVDIIGGASGTQTNLLTIRSNFLANGTATGLRLINSTAVGSDVGSEIVSYCVTSANGRSDLFFKVHGGGVAGAGALNERMRIMGTGQVIINNTAPVAGDVFSVYATTATLSWAVNGYNATTLGGSGTFDNSNISCGFNALEGSTSGTQCAVWGFANRVTGNAVGTRGTSNSSDAYGVYGSVPTTGTWFGYGGLFIGGLGYANGLYNLSDFNAKSNITPLEKVIPNLMKIETINYRYDQRYFNDNREYYGLIAQNIDSLFPNSVAVKYIPVREKLSSTKSLKNYETEEFMVIDYVSLVPVLVKAIQEQQIEIQKLKEEIEILKSR